MRFVRRRGFRSRRRFGGRRRRFGGRRRRFGRRRFSRRRAPLRQRIGFRM